AFSRILDACSRAGGRVMSIHSLRAAEAVLDALEQKPDAGVPVLHWFTGSSAELQRAVSMDCWFSVGPAMLATKSGRELARYMPHDGVLTESDGPFATRGAVSLYHWQAGDAVASVSLLWELGVDTVEEILLS